jgi:DNA-binding NarL/FixJ family response regulator
MSEVEPVFDLEIDTGKFDTVRRKLSLDKNKDLSSAEVITILIDNAYKNAIPKKRNRVGVTVVKQAVEQGLSVSQICEKYDISMSTVFRLKKLAKQAK